MTRHLARFGVYVLILTIPFYVIDHVDISARYSLMLGLIVGFIAKDIADLVTS